MLNLKSELLVPRFSFIPFLIGLSLFLGSYFNNDVREVKNSIEKIGIETNLSDLENKLYLEFCLTRVVERENCFFSQPFFLLKRQNFVYDMSRTKNLKGLISKLGNGFSTTEHFSSFYYKLKALDPGLSDLPSIGLYHKLVNEKINWKNDIFKKHMVLTKSYQTASRYMSSFIFVEGILLTILGFSIIFFSGLYLEQFFGSLLYSLVLLVPSFLILVYYVKTVPADSNSIIIGGGILINFSLGLTFSALKGFRFFCGSYHFRFSPLCLIIFILFEIYTQISSDFATPARAHFLSFLCGILIPIFYKKLRTAPQGFFSNKEYKHWCDINNEEDIFKNLNMLQELIKKNSINTFLIDRFLESIIRGMEKKTNQKAFHMHLMFIADKVNHLNARAIETLFEHYQLDEYILEFIMVLDPKLLEVLIQNKNLGQRYEIIIKLIRLLSVERKYKLELTKDLYQIAQEDLVSVKELVDVISKNANEPEGKDIFFNILNKINS